jgi:hypothetical protein
MPHIIRLRGPWEQEPQPSGQVRYARRFNCPTGLEGGDRVWLAIEFEQGEISLNGQPLGAAGGRFDITPLLQPANRLLITTAPVVTTDTLARLEIGE